MLKYEIEGGNLPVVICYPEAGQTLCTQSGAMSWMSPNMDMQTNTGGGLKKALGRLLAGESIFLNEYTPEGGQGMIAFASSFPGSIIPFQITPRQWHHCPEVRLPGHGEGPGPVRAPAAESGRRLLRR